jgi:hypothetical protein
MSCAKAPLTLVNTGSRWSRPVIRKIFTTGGCGAMRP